MAFDTVANVVSDAAIQLGLVSEAITDPYASTDDNIRRLLQSLKQLGQDLLRDHDWSHLTKEHTFSTVNGTANYDLPTHFARFVPGTAWNRTQGLELGGPMSPQQWQMAKAQTATSSFQSFRIWQDDLWIYPTPSSAETVAYEYVSKLWVMATASSAPDKEHPTVSTDVLWFDRQLLVWGLRLYHRRDEGFPSEVEQNGFDAALAAAQGGDGASPTLSLTGPRLRSLRSVSVPDSGWGT